MKKTTAKKVSKKTSPKDSKKKRSYVSDMMRRDMESCIEKDKELAKAGVQKPKKDIYKDDPCYGCTLAIENKNVSGPFDRRFKCAGYSRIVNALKEAIRKVNETASGDYQGVPIPDHGAWNRKLSQNEIGIMLFQAQQSVLYAASIIGERVVNGTIECVQTSGKPSCFVCAGLDEYLNAK